MQVGLSSLQGFQTRIFLVQPIYCLPAKLPLALPRAQAGQSRRSSKGLIPSVPQAAMPNYLHSLLVCSWLSMLPWGSTC